MKCWPSPILFRRVALLFGMLCAGALPGAATAAIVNVGGNSNGFSPQTLTINVGDSVTFTNKGGVHNVVADDGSFRCARGCDGDGKGGSGNATSSSWIAKVTFDTPGTVGYFCETHGMPGQGMYGTILVLGPTGPPPPPSTDPIPALNVKVLLLLCGVLALIAIAVLKRRRT